MEPAAGHASAGASESHGAIRGAAGGTTTFATNTRARGAGGRALPRNHRNCGRRERRLRHDQRRQEDRRSREHPAFAAACRCPQVGGSQTRAEEIRRPHKPRCQGTRAQLPAGDPDHRGWSAARRVCSTACIRRRRWRPTRRQRRYCASALSRNFAVEGGHNASKRDELAPLRSIVSSRQRAVNRFANGRVVMSARRTPPRPPVGGVSSTSAG
jgi:hypothetical protein